MRVAPKRDTRVPDPEHGAGNLRPGKTARSQRWQAVAEVGTEPASTGGYARNSPGTANAIELVRPAAHFYLKSSAPVRGPAASTSNQISRFMYSFEVRLKVASAVYPCVSTNHGPNCAQTALYIFLS